MTLREYLDIIRDGGYLVILIVVLITGRRGWWVFGWVYEQERSRGDKLEQQLYKWEDFAVKRVERIEAQADLIAKQ